MEFLKNKPISIDACLGHSVGECSALAACGLFQLKMPLKQSTTMEIHAKAVPVGKGKMIALLKVPRKLSSKPVKHLRVKWKK